MKKTLLLFFATSLFISCSLEPFDSFKAKVKEYALSDGIITLQELAGLQLFVEKHQAEPGFEIFFTNGKTDNAKIISYLEKNKYKVEKPYNAKTDTVNIYIENSLSMVGYINNNGSSFKNALAQIFSISEKFKAFTSNYINAQIIPVQLNADNVVDINTITFAGGNIKSSNLDGIFKLVLSKTDKKTISILVSDCIYSIEKGDATELLKRQALLTQRTFEKKLQEANNFSTLVIKLDSDFAGTYYDKRDRAYDKIKIKRPYYLIIMGEDAAVTDFQARNNASTLDGYANSYTINAKNYSSSLFHSVVTAKNSNTTFRPIDELSDGKTVKGIEDISVDEGDFTFTVAIDFSTLPVEEAYIKDKNNYSIIAGDYSIETIKNYDAKTVEGRDANALKKSGSNPTHLITFKATSKNYESLKFALTRKTPQWVTNTSIENDTVITSIEGKTFGFKYLINGIEKAYNAKNGAISYFEILITINN